ncbi:MAG: peptidylprolyl isomerase [Fimbriimonadaceae bacterium]|nr:MAG: peptidylprolyl isomerase [Fimbriimonadaceae bacterium]
MLSACLAAALLMPTQELNHVEFIVDGRGSFTIELDRQSAPLTCKHFQWLIEQKVYDGMLFHRKVNGFVLQTGDPTSKAVLPSEARVKPGEHGGTEGLGEEAFGPTIPFEKSPLSHVKGTLGIALESPGDNSGSSHFFINLADNKRLDGKYVAFGKISSGWDVIEKCQRGDLIRSARMK